MKMLGFTARLVLFPILVFQISFGHTLAYAAADGSGVAHVNPYTPDKTQIEIEKTAAAIDSGEFFKQDPRNLDIRRTTGQRVEIIEKGQVVQTYFLDDFRIDKPTIVKTSIVPKYNAETRELIFEAKTGAMPDGTGGNLKARHVIQLDPQGTGTLDVVAMDYDSELLMFVDSKGRLHAIDMGYTSIQAFATPIPVFRNLWEPKEALNLIPGETRVEFLTRGVTPTEMPLNPIESVVAIDQNGKLTMNAGDLLVRYKENGKEKSLGIFSREVTSDLIAKAWDYDFVINMLMNSTDQNVSRYWKSHQTQIDEVLRAHKDMIDVSSRKHLSIHQFVTIEQLQLIQDRAEAFRQIKTRPSDSFTHEEWVQSNNELKAKATDAEKLKYLAGRAQVYGEEAVTEQKRQLNKDLFTGFLRTTEAQMRLQTEEGLAKGWQALLEQAPRSNPYGKDRKTKNITSERVAAWKAMGVMVAGSAAYLSGAFVYTANYENLQHIQVLNWMYENLYTVAMKDLVYRIPLSKHILEWSMVIPTIFASSLFVGKSIDALGYMYRNSTEAHGIFFRELQKTWGQSMSEMQRFLSSGLRIFSHFIYPYARVVIEQALGQKVMLQAIENGVNPLQIISKDSKIGQQLGLEKNEFVGLQDPYLDGPHQATLSERKAKIQSAIAYQNFRRKKLAWDFAAATISNKYQIDIASLTQAMDTTSAEEVEELFKKDSEWQILAMDYEKELRSMNTLVMADGIEDLTPEEADKLRSEIVVFTAKAQEIALHVKSRSELSRKAELRWKQLRAAPINAVNFLFLQNGKKDGLALRDLILGRFESRQSGQEMRNDQFVSVVTTALVGPRAKPNDPANLAASADGFLHTAPANSYDMWMNLQYHSLVSGAMMALVFQKAQALEETRYLPQETLTNVSTPRQEGFWKGLGNWITFDYSQREKDFGRDDRADKHGIKLGFIDSVINRWYNMSAQGDVGGVMLKRFSKKIATIQSTITMAVVFRGLFVGQSPALALAACAMMFTAGYWFYAWVWDFIQRGNQMIDQRIEKNDGQLDQAKYKIQRGLKDSNLELMGQGYSEIIALYEKHNPKALELVKTTVAATIKKAMGKNNKDHVDLTNAEKNYLGIITKIALAQKNRRLAHAAHLKNPTTETQAAILEQKQVLNNHIALLKQVLVTQQGYDKESIDKLNAQSTLEFSLSNPPVYTHPSKLLSEIFVWGGAIVTTVMYIPLSLMLFNEEDLKWGNIMKWTVFSAGLYATAFAAFGKTPWLYYEKMSKQSWLLSPESLYFRARSGIEKLKAESRQTPEMKQDEIRYQELKAEREKRERDHARVSKILDEQKRIDEKLVRQTKQNNTPESQGVVGKICRRLFNK